MSASPPWGKRMTRADLHELMGGKARVSEFFAGKRALSVAGCC
jgi:antitoxin component HigA of HigAB toxin-antitoxin module